MRSHGRYLLISLLLVLLLPLAMGPVSLANPDTGKVRPGRVWVRLAAGGPAELRGKAALLGQGEPELVVPQLQGAVLSVPPGQEVAVARRLSARGDVVYATALHSVQAQWTPNDPLYSSQWSLPKIGAPQAWDAVRDAQAVVIAVLDTGVDVDHPDLAGCLWTNEGEIAGNGVDDDGNGLVDDVHGWNYVSGTNNVDDDFGHGTHVTGIAAGVADNDTGIAGLGIRARIMPLKVLDDTGSGWDSDIALAVVYAVDKGARVINLSLGVQPTSDWDPSESPMADAVAYARAHGVLVVAAAGNSNMPSVFYPAAYPEAMAVAATTSSDERAYFSNYGPEISVAAPGTNVLSTCMGGNYCLMSGTSMATPHVAGLAALIWALHPGYTVDQVQQRIESTAVDVNAATLPGKDDYLGYGRIDAAAAVGSPPEYRYRYFLPFLVAGSDSSAGG